MLYDSVNKPLKGSRLTFPFWAKVRGQDIDLSAATVTAVAYTTVDSVRFLYSSVLDPTKPNILPITKLGGNQFSITLEPEQTKQMKPGRIRFQVNITDPTTSINETVLIPTVMLLDAYV